MKKKVVIAAVIIAVAAAAVFFMTHKKGDDKSGQYLEAAAAVTDLSEYVEVTGYVAPLNRVEITPSASGRIEKIMVDEGMKIKAGQTLALMSSSDRVAILDAARSMGGKDYDYWQDAYKPIKVVSPLDGTIILKNVVEGQTVSASTVLFAISDRLIVKTTVDESDIGSIKVGQRAVVTLDAYPNVKVEGTIFQILDEGSTVNNVITYVVKIRMDKVPKFYKSEMTANAKVRVSSDRKVLLVPANAVTISPSGKTAVITAVQNGKPVYTEVATGVMENDKTEIISGIKDGDKVFYKVGNYVAQKDDGSGSNPLMPNRSKKSSSSKKKTDNGGPVD